MQNRQLNNFRWGMTLVELLVVATILVVLLAISVPILKPVLESRKTSNAAQVLAGVFQNARMKSIQEGKSYGVLLCPFETAPTTAIQLRFQQELVSDYLNPPDIRVRVKSGNIIPYRYSNENGRWESVAWGEVPEARNHFSQGNMVQFNRLGRFFEFSAISNGFALEPPYDQLDLPDIEFNDAMEYRVSYRSSGASWFPPAVMPRGTVVDLAFSGGETRDFAGGAKKLDAPDYIPPYFSHGDVVIVMFSPAGHVDELYVNGVPSRVNEMLYFCVGEWDRQVDANRTPLAEDGKTNLAAPATYWVSLHPKTGGTRIAENAPIQTDVPLLDQLRDARRFAREHFFNVGGN